MGERMTLAVTAAILLRGTMKGQDAYGAFIRGGKRGGQSALGLLPALCAMMAMVVLVNASGLGEALSALLGPMMDLLRLPREVAGLFLLRPLSGSGSLSALQEIFAQYGVDSRAGRVASVLVSSSETIFYTMTVYLGATDVRQLPWALPVSLFSYVAGAAVCGLTVQ